MAVFIVIVIAYRWVNLKSIEQESIKKIKVKKTRKKVETNKYTYNNENKTKGNNNIELQKNGEESIEISDDMYNNNNNTKTNDDNITKDTHQTQNGDV